MVKWVIRCKNRYIGTEKPEVGSKSVATLDEAFKFVTEHRARIRLASLDSPIWLDEGKIEPVEVPDASP